MKEVWRPRPLDACNGFPQGSEKGLPITGLIRFGHKALGLVVPYKFSQELPDYHRHVRQSLNDVAMLDQVRGKLPKELIDILVCVACAQEARHRGGHNPTRH